VNDVYFAAAAEKNMQVSYSGALKGADMRISIVRMSSWVVNSRSPENGLVATMSEITLSDFWM
jgi:hypothetical protein